MNTLQETQFSNDSGKASTTIFYSQESLSTGFNQRVPQNLGFSNKIIRRYNCCIIMCQLIITLVIVALGTLHGTTKLYINSHRDLTLSASIINLGSIFGLLCHKKVCYINFILLFVFTFSGSYIIVESVSYNYPKQVFLILCLITIICLALTIIGFHNNISSFNVVTLMVISFLLDVFIYFLKKDQFTLIVLRDLVITIFNNMFIIYYLQNSSHILW